ncbi:MAG TPA: Ig-like domain-containing protein [Gaiellaceae bacterium]|nr:Ig-like domain-containing protein [Gaiellaceae bacterium]
MASFPDLRPDRRSAKAEGTAAPRNTARLLIAVSAALLLTASLAVSELATLRGAQAHGATAFLTRELGPPLDRSSLVRRPARGLKVALSQQGFRVERGTRSLGLALEGSHASRVQTFQHGTSATTDFGRVVVAATPKKTEQYLVVHDRQGPKTWSWRLDTDGLRPRVGGDGSVGFLSGHHLTDSFYIGSPKILDRHGRDISPDGLHWELTRGSGAWSLLLTVDDRDLPTPYVIDPASFNVGVGTNGPTTAAASVTLNVPASVRLGDLLIAHVAWLGGSGVTSSQPGGWTQLDTTRNQGTSIGAEVWYKNASVADTSGGTYTWSFSPNAIATGGLAAYTGIDKTATPEVAQLVTPATNDTTIYYPSITPSANNAQVLSVVAHAKASSGTRLTPPTSVNGAAGAPGVNTERWETANAGGIASELSDFTQATAGAVNTNGSNTYTGNSGKNIPHVAFRIALKADATAPSSSFGLASVSPAGSAYYPGSGTTVWYRGTGPNCTAETQVAGRCSFVIRNTVSDAGSGPASSQFNALGGTSTGWSFTSSTVTTPAGGPYDSNFYSWSSGTSSAPTENIVGRDNGGNSDGGTTLTLTSDTSGPSVPVPTVTAGYYSSLSIGVSLGSVTDTGGSGVNASTLTVERDAIGLSNGSCGVFTGSWSTVTLSGGNDTTVTSGNCYRYRETARDNVGNSTTSAVSNTAKVDTSAPSTPTLAFSGLSANAYYDGSGTLYIRPAAGGTFTVTANSSDSDSGIGGYTFGTLNSNGGSNFGGSQTGDHFDYTFGASTTTPTTDRTVNSSNGAGTNSSDATYAINADTAAPSVTAPGVTAGYFTSNSVPVTKNGGSDGGSGVDNTTSVLQRDEVALTAGTCGVFTGTWSPVTLSGGNDTTVTNGTCYRYRELLSDQVGNQGSSGASNTAKVDSQAPANSIALSNVSPVGSAAKTGTTVYYRGSVAGSFRLTNSVSDSESGPASSATGALGGTSSGWSHVPSTVSTPAGGPYDSNSFSWSAGTASSPTEVVTGADASGNTTASATLTFTDDSAAPAGGALTVNNVAATGVTPASYDTDGSFPIDVRTDYADGPGESGLASSTLVRTSATFSSPDTCGAFGSATTIVGNPSQSGLATGCYKYTLTGTDNVGNTASIATIVKVDTDNPSVSLTDPGTPLAGTVGLDAGAADSTTGVVQVVFERTPAGGSTWTTIGTDSSAPFVSNWDTTGVSDGLYDVRALATDTAGNTNTSLVANRRVDNTAPNTTLDSSPADPSNNTTPSFSFTSSESGSTYQCRLDGGSWASCTSPHTISPALAAGSHTFDVRATDQAGNTDATPASYTWTVDVTAPDTTIDSSPGSPSGNTTPTFTFHASESGTTFECRQDGGSWTSCSSPDTISPALAEGSHTFDVRAVDAAGNADGSPASHTWIIDVGPPNTTIDSSPGSPSSDTTPTFTFSSSESGSTFECRVDGGSWSSCSSPETVAPALAAGSHTFDVRATDVAGNTDPTPASYTWTIDLTAPNTTIDAAPADPSNDATPAFSFSSSEPGSSFECRVDGGSWSACSSPETVAPALAAGSHTFDVRATDVAGNTDPTPASYTWTIDLTAPNTTIDAAPADPSNNTTPDFSFSSSEPGSSFECRVDGGSWTPCSSPDTVSPALAAGSHTFDVRATDQAGNTDGTPASRTWTVDLTAPNTTIDANPADPSNDTTPDFSFSSSESGSTFQCRVDGGSWNACTSPDTISPALAAGSHTFDVRATDQAGNTDGTPATRTWTVDLTAPNTTIDTSPPDPSNDTTPAFAFSSSESGSTFECRLDGGSWNACTSPDTISPALAAGSHTFDVRATDQAGNTDATPASRTWTVDLTAPNTTIDAQPMDPTNDPTPDFTFSSSEAGSTFECRVDGGSWSSCASTYTISPALAAGSHTFDVRATDEAGNTDSTPAGSTWTVDLTAPNTTIDSGPADPSGDATPNFAFSSSETGSSFECRVDGGSWSACTSPDTVSPALAAGSHTFDVRATDQAGNTDATPATRTWTLDLTAPNTTIDSNPADPSGNTTPTFSFSSSESGSTFECRLDGGSWTPCSSPNTLSPALAAGSHTFDVRATDQAGNTDATPASYAWTVDLTAPNTTIDSNPADPSGNTTPTFTFSSSESGSTFECRLDGGSWAPCSSPDTISPALTEGSHTFDVRARDQAGNTDTTPAGYTWVIDAGSPTVTISSPTTYVNGSDPNNFVVAASTPDTDVTRVDFFECSDGSTACSTGTWAQFGTDNAAPYAATWSTPAFDGPKALRALAVDAASNTGQHVRTITIDRTAPSNVTVTYPSGYVTGSYSVTTDNGPDTDVNAGSGSLERRTGDLTNDSCSSYGGWVAATSPDTLASGRCAQYRYSVADQAGNVALATSPNEVKSDTAAPTSTLADPGANLRQTITLTASAGDTDGSDVDSVAFQRRPTAGGSWSTIAADSTSPYSTSFDTTSVADALYDFRTVATDTAGNTEASPVVVANRRVDNTAPSATMLGPGNPVSGSASLTSNTSDTGGSGIATVAYELAPNGGSYNSQPASWDTTLVSDGFYDLRVVATDVAGNSTTSTEITTRVDNTPPAVTFSNPASGGVVMGTVNLVGSASDASPASPAVSFAYKLHSDPASAYTATGASWNTATLPGGDGLYDLRARATDAAGNTSSVENTNIRVDNAPPTIAITAPATAINGSLPSPTTFAANASDPAGSGVAQVQFFECSDQSNDCATGIWNPLGTVAAPGPYGVSWSIPAADGNHALAAVATDDAGHPATAIRNVDVDRTAPNTTIVSKPADPSNDAVPTFTFGSTEPGSTFECRIDGASWAPCTSPHNVSGLTDNDHTFDVRATDAAGNTDATAASWNWHRDTSAPTGTLNNPGANVRQMVTLTSSESDPPADGYASGLDSVSFGYSANGTTWALIGTNTSTPFDSAIWNTLAVTDGVYQLRLVVRDAAGNSTISPLGSTVRVDNTPPTTSQNDPGPYLRGTRQLSGSAADSGSGVDHVDFQRAPTGGGSWMTVAIDSTPGDGLQVNFDTTGVSDGHYDFRTVAYDVAGNQAASTPVTDRLVDNTAPSATMTNPGPYLRGAVNLTSTTSDPGGADASGVVSVAYEYSTNSGGSWQSTGASFNSAAAADGNVDLHVIATDAAGNTTTSAAVTSLVDNTKPVTTDNAPGGWQSSAVTFTLSPADAGSGVNVTEYSVDGNPSYTVGTSVTIPAPADGSNDGAHTIAYFTADNAGNIETIKSTTVLIDATPPACPSCSAADYLRGTVDLSADPDSGGSGIKSVSFEYADAGGSTWTTIGTDTSGPGPYTASWDTTSLSDGHYDLRIAITDNADNVTTASLPDKVVDNTAPDVALVGAPTEGQLVSGTISIAASASDATSPVASVKFYVRGTLLGTATTAPFSQSWNTTTGADGGATIQVVVEDLAGNATSSTMRNVLVDNVAPTPTLGDPGQNLSGTISLSVSSDPDTTQVDFERRPAGGGSWVTIASDTTTPWSTSLDTTALADGLYDFRAVATDQTAQTGTSPVRSDVRVDNTAPAGSLTAPASGATVGGTSVSLSGSYSDGGSGVASVRYELRPTGGGSWTTITTTNSAPFTTTWDATTVVSGSYDLQPVVTDRAGNTSTGAVRTITVDVSAPTVTLANPGATVSGSVTLNAAVSGTGAVQVAFAASPAGGASWSSLGTDTSAPWSATFDSTKLTDGIYDLRAMVTDNHGNSSSDVVSSIRIDNTAPRVVSSNPAEGSTVSSANGIELTASEPATPVGVTLDGSATVAPVLTGTQITFGTGPLGPGLHTLAGELQDSSGRKTPFRVHFTVYTGSGSPAPPVDKNTSAGSSTTVESTNGFAAATMPARAWSATGSDWLVLRITPLGAPAGLTDGFAPGPDALDVTARWALGGGEVHQFSQPIGILLRSTKRGLVPATLENGHWRILARVPAAAGTLPAGWEDGFYTDGSGFHVLTMHLSVFALLRDVEAPNAPQNVRGYLGPSGLTLRWTPGTDNSDTYDFVTLFSDAKDAGHFGVDYTAAGVGSWSTGDPRVFRLQETDLAGNQSALTRPLRPVPSLIGKTPDQASALLAPLGFKLGTITAGGTGPAGTITGPAGLALAEEGSTIDVTVSGGAALTRLTFKVVTAPKLKPAVRKSIVARIAVTRAARVTAELYSPRHVRLFTWRFSVKAGHSLLTLRLPRQVRRSGVYTMRWSAHSGRETVSRRITIRMIGSKNLPAQPVRVVLAGSAATGIRGTFSQLPRLVRSSSVEPTFDAAASRRSDVRVIVIDVNDFGVGMVRELHAVFPALKIVALTSSPRQLAAALKAGASVALPPSTPASMIARVIQRLLAKPPSPQARRPGR